jgi:glycosyltransferase involved in cell wall biosynthesis
MTMSVDEIARDPAGDVLLSLVVPVYNEAETVALFIDRVSTVFRAVAGVRIEVVFVNDGSRDDTLSRVLVLQKADPRVRVIDLSRNFGKEAALSAGLVDARGDVIVPIDVDLQDPPELILEMITKWREGFDVVVGRRVNRDSDTAAKRMSATWFYRIHNAISDLQIPENVGDFRLMDRAVVDALREMPESRRFMKGLFAWAGFRTAYVEYARPPRSAGSGKFGGWKLWNFALEGITSFSTIPLRIWTYAGLLVAAGSVLYAAFIVLTVFVRGIDVPGYASLLVAVMLLGGIQLIGIGVLGEYLGRTYLESKRRPVFIIRRIYETKG